MPLLGAAPSGRDTAHAVLDIVHYDALRPAAVAAGKLIEDASPTPLFTPGRAPGTMEIHVIIKAAADNRSPADLISVQLDGRDLITDTQPEASLVLAPLLGNRREVQLGAVIDILSRYHLLPRQFLKVNQNLDDEIRLGEFAGVETEP